MIWISSISKKQLKQLKTVQKKALQIVFSKKYNAQTDGLFEKGRITKVENIFEKEALVMTHKFQKKNYLQQLCNSMKTVLMTVVLRLDNQPHAI